MQFLQRHGLTRWRNDDKLDVHSWLGDIHSAIHSFVQSFYALFIPVDRPTEYCQQKTGIVDASFTETEDSTGLKLSGMLAYTVNHVS